MTLVMCELMTENPENPQVILVRSIEQPPLRPARSITRQIDDTCDVQTKTLCVWGGTDKAKVNAHEITHAQTSIVPCHFLYKNGGFLAVLYIKLYIKGQVSRSTAHQQT